MSKINSLVCIVLGVAVAIVGPHLTKAVTADALGGYMIGFFCGAVSLFLNVVGVLQSPREGRAR